jgi:hypothetical protein
VRGLPPGCKPGIYRSMKVVEAVQICVSVGESQT